MAVDILRRSLEGVDMCRWDDEELVLVDACDRDEPGEATNADVGEAALMAAAAAIATNDFMFIAVSCGKYRLEDTSCSSLLRSTGIVVFALLH